VKKQKFSENNKLLEVYHILGFDTMQMIETYWCA